MDKKILDAAHAAFPPSTASVTLGAIVHDGECVPSPVGRHCGEKAGAADHGANEDMEGRDDAERHVR